MPFREDSMSVCDELDEVAAAVVEDRCRDRSHRRRRLREGHPSGAEALVLGLDVVDGEGRQRDPRLAVWLPPNEQSEQSVSDKLGVRVTFGRSMFKKCEDPVDVGHDASVGSVSGDGLDQPGPFGGCEPDCQSLVGRCVAKEVRPGGPGTSKKARSRGTTGSCTRPPSNPALSHPRMPFSRRGRRKRVSLGRV